MERGIIPNIGFVIEMPGGMEGIGIDGENNDKDRDNREDVSATG